MERRPERGGDAGLLLALFAAAGGELFAGFESPLRDLLLHGQCAAQDASYRAAHPAGRFDVIEDGGVPVGRLVTDLSAASLTLVDIALLPDRRGRGLGERLMRELQAEARAAGVPLRLAVLRGNAGALRFYARLGFAPASGTDTHLDLQWTP